MFKWLKKFLVAFSFRFPWRGSHWKWTKNRSSEPREAMAEIIWARLSRDSGSLHLTRLAGLLYSLLSFSELDHLLLNFTYGSCPDGREWISAEDRGTKNRDEAALLYESWLNKRGENQLSSFSMKNSLLLCPFFSCSFLDRLTSATSWLPSFILMIFLHLSLLSPPFFYLLSKYAPSCVSCIKGMDGK